MPAPRLLAVVLPLVLVSSIAATAEAAAKPAKLTVSISGLPRGAKASVKVRGPHFSRVVRRAKTFTGVRPGGYTLTGRQVRTKRAPTGSRAGAWSCRRRRRSASA